MTQAAVPCALEHARALLAEYPVIDGHNDLPFALLAQVGYDLDRGWSDADIAKLTWHNTLRVVREAETTAAKLRRTRRPSIATIYQLDGWTPAQSPIQPAQIPPAWQPRPPERPA